MNNDIVKRLRNEAEFLYVHGDWGDQPLRRLLNYAADDLQLMRALIDAIDRLPDTLPTGGFVTEQFTMGWAAAMHQVKKLLNPEEVHHG
jgi:hypothetical protein